jgi:hypothetical protein
MPDFTALAIKDDRPRHPYVADHPDTDTSAREWTNDHGETVSVEEQAWASRSIFHTIEGIKGPLTPLGMLYVTQMMLHNLLPARLVEGTDVEPEELDPSGAFLEFERRAGDHLRAALEEVEAALDLCPGCGRKHDDIGWVHSATGQSVRVERLEDREVWFRREVAPGEWSDMESMGRVAFEQVYVRAAGVALLGDE